MNLVTSIFLCYVITFVHAREDPLLQNDLAPVPNGEPRKFEKARAVVKENAYYAELPLLMKAPYIEPKCCNYSTTDRCSNMGYGEFKGRCIPQNETCLGNVFYGTKYCVISKHKSCKCCVPTDCRRQGLDPCKKLNGTCIGIKKQCNGTSVISGDFCRKDTKIDTCQCCIPLVQPEEPEECPCGQNFDGICIGKYPQHKELASVAISIGSSGKYPQKWKAQEANGSKWRKGHCMKECHRGHTELVDHTCNKTGGTNCKCCDLENYCGPECEPFKEPTLCMCSPPGESCPTGMCSHSNFNMCPDKSCYCCADKTECTSNGECSGLNDKCVDKMRADCPKGYAKVYDACSKGKERCDCCKNIECSSIDDKCTGRGEFCIDYESKCPKGFSETLDCSKPIIFNGTIIGKKKCKCCKPMSAECPEHPKGCFRVGSQCFLQVPLLYSNWKDANEMCQKHGQSLAEPQAIQAVSQYLTENYDAPSYWIGARGTTNGKAVWLSGGEIGPDAPWQWPTSYLTCYPNTRVYLQAYYGCLIGNSCIGCWIGNGGPGRAPLCTCNIED